MSSEFAIYVVLAQWDNYTGLFFWTQKNGKYFWPKP